jgi:predicted AlkP superfamily phosphohydrolase/phosphomutase
MLDLELSRFDSGLLAFVFDSSDRIQHAFWSMRDPKHPMYDANLAAKYADVIPNVYREMDSVLGSVLAKCDAKTALIVLSDHGFNSFRRAVHVNRWLIQNGYMTLKDGNDQPGQDLFKNVDWSRTKAYAIGFTNIYINLKGREGQGVVASNDAAALSQEIAAKLREWKDPDTTEALIKQVYIAREIYSGKALADGPDLVVGLNPGYRASAQTVLGGAPLNLVEDNKKRWSGDHLIDPSCVPGILFTNQKLNVTNPGLTNVAPTVLKCLGVKAPDQMKDPPLFP